MSWTQWANVAEAAQAALSVPRNRECYRVGRFRPLLSALRPRFVPADEHEHVLYVEKGDCRAVWDDGDVTRTAGGFLFVPSENVLALHGSEGTRLTIFRKMFEPVENLEAPPAVHGNVADIPAELIRAGCSPPCTLRATVYINCWRFCASVGLSLPFSRSSR